MDEINAITPEQIQTLRRNFHEKVTSQSPGHFHPDDLKRVDTDDLWCKRFIANAESNVDNATTMLYDCCQWRKEFGTNELDANKVGMDLVDKGVLFIRNKDVFGKKLLVFKAKNHTKGTVPIEKLQQNTVYWFERIERESNSDQISIIFDMKDTGWNNMDMDFVRYLITLLKTYYPYFVNYLVIYEMPWLLNAAWKIIKGWLPPKFVDRVKFLDKKTLKDFIDPDNQLAEWGGNDKYVFKFEPEVKNQRPGQNNISASNGGVTSEAKSRNKVQFTGHEQVRDVHQFEYSESTSGSPSPIPSSTMTLGSPAQNGDNCLADIEERITFRPSENDEYSARLAVRNKAPNGDSLIIKIKTTSPEKYRVKPIIAVLRRNATATITVSTHQGVSAVALTRDRFQVQVAIIPENMMPVSGSEASDASISDFSHPNFNDLGNNFKQIVGAGAVLETYRVAVAVEPRPGDNGLGSGNSIGLNDDRLRRGLDDLEKKITESVSNKVMANIAASQRLLVIALGIITFLFLSILVYLYKLSQGSADCSKVCSSVIESGHWTGTLNSDASGKG